MGNPKVIILGGGASSVYAYYGALAADYKAEEVQIWATGLTYPPGAFWLHELPPNYGAEERPSEIEVRLQGTTEAYSRRQWGNAYPTSVDTYCGRTVKAYNPHVYLPRMWEGCNRLHVDRKWNLEMIHELAQRYAFVIVTFPVVRRAIRSMQLLKVPVYHNDNPSLHTQHKGDYCLYNGMSIPEMEWVRVTKAFGRVSSEYPHTMTEQLDYILGNETRIWGKGGTVSLVPELHPTTVKLTSQVLGQKDNIILTGRWATLNRKALSHHSFHDTFMHLTGANYESVFAV